MSVAGAVVMYEAMRQRRQPPTAKPAPPNHAKGLARDPFPVLRFALTFGIVTIAATTRAQTPQ